MDQRRDSASSITQLTDRTESRELEQAKIELEKVKADAEIIKAQAEVAKQEAETIKQNNKSEIIAQEKAKQEAETKKQQLEYQKNTEAEAASLKAQAESAEQESQQQLKIEKCKAQAQAQVDAVKKQFTALYLKGQDSLKKWEQAILDNQILYSECILKPADPQLSYETQNRIREAECNYYLKRKSQLEQELIQERNKLSCAH